MTVDLVVLAGSKGDLRLLLIRRGLPPFESRWALPGGFVQEDEPLEAAARRELLEETGLTGLDLVQIGAFGDPGRDPRGHTISIAYACWTRAELEVSGGDDAAEARWWPVDSLPALAFDHDLIVTAALARLDGPK